MHLSTITNRCAEVPQLLNTPPWHADFNRRRAGEARPKGKHSSGRMALAPIRAREFSLPRSSSAASHLNSTDFHVTHRFFVTFFPEESNVPPSSPFIPPLLVPRPLLGTAAGIGKTVETFLCIYAVLYCEKVTLYPHFRDNLRGKVVDNLDNKVGITFTIHSGFPPLK